MMTAYRLPRFVSLDGDWLVEPVTLAATGHRHGDAGYLRVKHLGHDAGSVRYGFDDAGQFDAATLAALARLGVPLAELRLADHTTTTEG